MHEEAIQRRTRRDGESDWASCKSEAWCSGRSKVCGLLCERGKKAGKQVSRIANLWGNSVSSLMAAWSAHARFATRLCASSRTLQVFCKKGMPSRDPLMPLRTQPLHTAYGNASKTLHPRAARLWISHDLNVADYTSGLLKPEPIG